MDRVIFYNDAFCDCLKFRYVANISLVVFGNVLYQFLSNICICGDILLRFVMSPFVIFMRELQKECIQSGNFNNY